MAGGRTAHHKTRPSSPPSRQGAQQPQPADRPTECAQAVAMNHAAQPLAVSGAAAQL